MTGKKKFESGTHKRKVVREKESREKELLKSIPKLTGFFKRPAADDGGPTKCSVSHSPEAADEAGLAQVEVTGEEKRRGAEDEEEVEEEKMEEEEKKETSPAMALTAVTRAAGETKLTGRRALTGRKWDRRRVKIKVPTSVHRSAYTNTREDFSQKHISTAN